MRRGDVLHDLVQPFLSGIGTLDGDQLPVDAKDDRSADLQVNIGRATFHGRLQNTLKHFHKSKRTQFDNGTKDEKSLLTPAEQPRRALNPMEYNFPCPAGRPSYRNQLAGLSQRSESERIQARFSLLGQSSEDHRHVIARV